jgi:hypothetical protein
MQLHELIWARSELIGGRRNERKSRRHGEKPHEGNFPVPSHQIDDVCELKGCQVFKSHSANAA